MRSLLLAALLAPAAAFAADPPLDLIEAMDVDPTWLIANSVSTNHPLHGATHPATLGVVSSLGVIPPYGPPDMAMLSTGNVDGLCNDYDFPPGGAPGDRSTLAFELQVPEDANSYAFNFYFLSREYPDFVGDIYNDEFQVDVVNPAWSGQVVLDAFGNVVSVNSALFAVVDPVELTGTCFDEHGGTGWTQTVAPVEPGSILELRFTLADEGDGIYDSAVLVDNFRFSETEIEEPGTEKPETGGPLRLSFLSPKEGDAAGGYEVLVTGRGFTPETTLWVDGVEVPAAEVLADGSGELLTVTAMPAHPAGDVDIEVRRGDEVAVLGAGFSYWEAAGGERPPRILGVVPGSLPTEGGVELQVRAEDVQAGATAMLLSLDAQGAVVDTWDLPVLGRVELDGATDLFVEAPPHAEGWVDLILVNPSGARSTPGYPLQYTEGSATVELPPGGCPGCSATHDPGWLGLLLIAAVRRRRRSPNGEEPPGGGSSRHPESKRFQGIG